MGSHLVFLPVPGVHLLQPLLGQVKIVLDLRRDLQWKHQRFTMMVPEAGNAIAGSTFGTT